MASSSHRPSAASRSSQRGGPPTRTSEAIPPEAPDSTNRWQRRLAAIMLTLLGLSVAAIITTAVVTRGGTADGKGLEPWAIVFVFPLIALPLAALCLIAIIVLNVLHRRHISREVSR